MNLTKCKTFGKNDFQTGKKHIADTSINCPNTQEKKFEIRRDKKILTGLKKFLSTSKNAGLNKITWVLKFWKGVQIHTFFTYVLISENGDEMNEFFSFNFFSLNNSNKQKTILKHCKVRKGK